MACMAIVLHNVSIPSEQRSTSVLYGSEMANGLKHLPEEDSTGAVDSPDSTVKDINGREVLLIRDDLPPFVADRVDEGHAFSVVNRPVGRQRHHIAIARGDVLHKYPPALHL